jgi:hypothetical protein
LALVFADAAERKAIWTQALKGWNVKESSVVNEWLQEGRVEGQRLERTAAVIAVLEARFGQVPADLAATINTTTNIATLQGWHSLAITVANLDEFRKVTAN